MRDHLRGYTWRAAGASNPSVQNGLDALFLELVLRFPDNKVIWDLGCGNGRLTCKLADGRRTVLGVDASASGIEIAKAACKGASFSLAEIHAPIVPSLLANHPAPDIVISSDVIEHMYRPRDLVETAYAALRPGGLLVVGTPYHGYAKNLAISLFDKWDAHHTVDWDGGHIKFFSVKSLRKVVQEAGFTSPEFHFFGRTTWLWKNMVCVALKPS